MPKSMLRRAGGPSTSPYSRNASKSKAANNIFKMNTDIGQHVLKNPGIAEAIIQKADLKQSDVRTLKFPMLCAKGTMKFDTTSR